MRILLLILGFLLLTACTNSKMQIISEFRDARARGDLETAQSYLSDDPRVWYGERTGDGTPWNLRGGRWKGWDDHFNGVSEVGDWHVEDDHAWAIVTEMNDYFLLCEAGPSPWKLTYFFNDDGRIEGTMVSAAPTVGDKGRRAEFDAWLKATHPDEYEYLRPGGDIDPTGDRPERTRALLHEWRREVGLPAPD